MRRKASTALPAHAEELALQTLALQPNAHAGNRHLPRHLDWPRHDGFGVVIVTVAVRGAGTVVLESRSGDIVRFDPPEGHAYCRRARRGTRGSRRGRGRPGARVAQFEVWAPLRLRGPRDGVYGRWADAACGAEGAGGGTTGAGGWKERALV